MKRLIEQDTASAIVSDGGALKVIPITENNDYFEYLDELYDEYNKEDHHGFYNNRDEILEAFIEKRLYTLRITRTQSSCWSEAWCDQLCVGDSIYKLPCLCITTKERKDTVTMLWTAGRARCKGFATALLEGLGVRYVMGIINHTESFWSKRGIREIRGIKPSFVDIIGYYSEDDDDDDTSSTLDEMYDSSEEEHDVESDAIFDEILYKQWLIGDAINVSDMGHVIGLLLRSLYRDDVKFTSIGVEYWSQIYGIMSEERIKTQEFKSTKLSHYAQLDYAHYFGQHIEGTDSIVRNKTMMISRLFHGYPMLIARLSRTLSAYNLRVHTEKGRFRNNPGALLVIIADTGINMEKAIDFARSIDGQNDFSNKK